MRHLLIIPAFVTAISGFAASAKGEDQYNCKTYRFSSVEDDKDFRAANERKEFVIYDIGETLVVKMSSPDLESQKTEYRVLFRDDSGLQAYVPSAFSFAFDTLNLSFHSKEGHGGSSEAAMNLLGSFYSNTWLLSCNKVQ